MVKTVLFLLTVIVCFCACFNKSSLPSPIVNKSNKLKLDGFYYQISDIGGHIDASIYFLYENGIVRFQGSKEYSSSEELKIRMSDLNLEDSLFVLKDGKYAYDYWGIWGVYEINNDSITIIQQFSGGKYRMSEIRGNLISNSQFYATSNTPKGQRVDRYRLSDNYYFVPTTSKPDSTNQFFK